MWGENCELNVTVQNQPFRLYSEVGLVRMETSIHKLVLANETERAIGKLSRCSGLNLRNLSTSRNVIRVEIARFNVIGLLTRVGDN